MPGLTHAYYSLNGQIQGERNIGTGEYTHYSTDALGSVSTMSGDKFDRCRYKPYGATLAGSPGTFGWVGSWGYAATGRSVSSHYVRARHYSTATRVWTTVDPLWPEEVKYTYALSSPTTSLDPLGQYTVRIGGPPCTKGTKVIFPEPGDGIGIVVGPPSKGKHPGTLINGANAIARFPGAGTNEDCIAVNGSLCGGDWVEGHGSSPVFDVTECSGQLYPGRNKDNRPKDLVSVPLRIGPGSTCAVEWPNLTMQPDAKQPRTGACISKKGNKLLGLIVTPKPPGMTAGDFSDCMKAHCPKGSVLVFLDGGTSTQAVERRANQRAIALVEDPKKGPRPVHDWIVICGKSR